MATAITDRAADDVASQNEEKAVDGSTTGAMAEGEAEIIFKGMSAQDASVPLTLAVIDMPKLRADQVCIQVQYCGLCYSDVAMIKNEFGMTSYPFIGGHEAVGRIYAVGANVTSRKVGQLVGVGGSAGFCLSCRQCLSGRQNLCPKGEMTMRPGISGGFANFIRATEAAAIPIPDGIEAKFAGPLMCGGITVFYPMLIYGLKPTDSIGILGIGGLGHLALQFARAWGCKVYAFTSSPDKAEQARKFGAHEVISSIDKTELKNAKGTLDFILNTANVEIDVPTFVNCLKPKGKLVIVGASLQMEVPMLQVVFHQATVGGSWIGGPDETRKMLEFAARHNIRPQIEEFKMSDVNSAIEKLSSNKMRYRAVLEMDL